MRRGNYSHVNFNVTGRRSSGKLRLDRRPTDIVTVLNNAMDVVRPAAEAKGVSLRTRYDRQPEVVAGDSVRLQPVIWNLLSNAIKFTPKGGRVELWLEGRRYLHRRQRYWRRHRAGIFASCLRPFPPSRSVELA